VAHIPDIAPVREQSKAPVVRWNRADWLAVLAYSTVIFAMHAVGFAVLIFLILPAHLEVGSRAFGLGLGLTAYVFGMRHAFDADHIAAIDNTTRKLMADGQRPKSVGFWFALGHSMTVFGMTAVVAAGAGAISHLFSDDSASGGALKTLGTLASASFLYLIGLVNLVALVGIWRMWRALQHGTFDEAELTRHLETRGVLARLLGKLGRAVRAPWHMAGLGLLFGLGFDTASEVALLVMAGSTAAAGLPWFAILVLPLLFAAGMSLLDFLDGLFMTVAYEWAFTTPVRKIYYNLSVTGLSVGVALIIGTIELASVLQGRLGPINQFTAWVGGVDLGNIGFIIVGVFVLTWTIAIAYWRLARVEERWESRQRDPSIL